MKNIFPKVVKNFVMMSMAVSMFVACGDDSGTGAKDDESSSSVVEESSSSLAKSSSSVASSSSEIAAVSSSSVESSSSNVTATSSSSIESSSSDVTEASSSSVESSSSEVTATSSSSIESSSSDVTEVSSSSVESSSSEVTATSSSSVIPSGGEESSSSSVEVIQSSSSEESSSSIASSSSLSSSSAESSSSVEVSSSSVESSSSAKSSSSVASSSSSVESSSSEKVTWTYLNPAISYGLMQDSRDKQYYKTVKIGNQVWMAENLNYNPGKVSSWSSWSMNACYGNSAENCEKYGRLYTWDVAMNDWYCAYGSSCRPSGKVRGICPEGWRLPSFNELITLVEPMTSSIDDLEEDGTGDYRDAGKMLKSQTGWKASVWGSSYSKNTNASGFTALPAGGIDGSRKFAYVESYAYFWSASENGALMAYGLMFDSNGYTAYLRSLTKSDVASVRCLKDN